MSVVDGAAAGERGWVWSDLVSKPQPVTDECDHIGHENEPAPPPPPPLNLEIVGTCTTAGGTLTSSSANFTAGGEYNVAATYPDGQPYTNLDTTGTVNSDGSLPWEWSCEGDPAGTYTTYLVDLATGRDVTATFTIDPAPEAPQAPQAPEAPSDPEAPTSDPGNAPGPGPAPAEPQAPSEQVLIYNKVTNGSSEMREDSPAYLSTTPTNHCSENGCALSGTDMNTGATATASCQTIGDRTTNGQDDSTVDDANPGLFTSDRWYGIRWSDGRFGYLAETWTDPADRGGQGLPQC
ncbi:hypothetical protein [Geodermatophilus maliterrae]|uniref:Uncharacterized protein n=1 Tax=Geodermatophilus maliterrae TaxID=3162531 RepID=A0ABV3XHS7_9ACTN